MRINTVFRISRSCAAPAVFVTATVTISYTLGVEPGRGGFETIWKFQLIFCYGNGGESLPVSVPRDFYIYLRLSICLRSR